MSCTNIPKDYKEMLDVVPSKWRDQILAVLINIKDEANSLSCESVKKCETLTSLSEFNVDGTKVSISYQDEKGVSITRQFDATDVLNNSLYDVDPKCLATQEEWRNMTFQQKMQAIISKICP